MDDNLKLVLAIIMPLVVIIIGVQNLRKPDAPTALDPLTNYLIMLNRKARQNDDRSPDSQNTDAAFIRSLAITWIVGGSLAILAVVVAILIAM